MKISLLRISNFLKIKDVEMRPGDTNVIVGKNRQGKTSILKAINAAFTGADNTSIRMGESKAEITVELEDLIIHRSITEKGNKLDITSKDGLKYPKPQQYLDGILGNFSFNPIEFFELKPTERKKYLLNAIKLNITPEELSVYTGEKLTGLDYENAHALEVIEDARKYYYDKRTVANAEKTKKEKSLADLNASIPEGFNPRDVSEEQISNLRNAIQTDEQTVIKHEAHQKNLLGLQKQEQDTKDEIARLTTKLTGIQDEIIKAGEVKFDLSDEATITAAKDALNKLEGQREILFTVKRAEEVRGELGEAVKEAEKLDTIVKRLSKEAPEALISKAKLPIEGLTIDGDNILVNGISIDNLSSSEQLKFGLQIVRALNGDFKVICVDGIESLDRESFEFFLKEVENDDYQYFVTRVKNAGETGIEIEEGEIKTS